MQAFALKSASLLATLALITLASGCAPEDYGPCTLPQSEVLQEACASGTAKGGGDEGPESVQNSSCVVDFVFECPNQLCGTFEGSDPFCTEECDPANNQCPKAGACVEWVPGIGEYFCVPPELSPGQAQLTTTTEPTMMDPAMGG